MLSNILKGAWKDDWASKMKRAEMRWPWRMEILQSVRERHPRFPPKTFDRRWNLVQIALEAMHDADPEPHLASLIGVMIVGFPEEATARRIAERYFPEHYHLFSWLYED